MSKDVEGRLIQQAIYEEIEKSPADEKVRKYLREKPYHLRKTIKVIASAQQGESHE